MRGHARRLMQWMDGHLNPIVVKELRQAVRGRFVVAVVMLSLLAETFAVAVFMVSSGIDADRLSMQPSGDKTFIALFTLLFGSTIFFIPIYSGLRMSAERSDSSADLIFITTVRPRTIVIGKVLSTAALTALIFFASLPFLVFSYVLRGIDVLTILVLLAIAFVLVCSHSILAMFLGCLPASKPFKFVLAGAFLAMTVGIYPALVAFLMEIIRSTSMTGIRARFFWDELGVALAIIAVVDLVLLVLTAGMIAPSTANRALPVRVALTLVWLLSLAAAVHQTRKTGDSDWILIWALPSVGAGILVLLSAIGERERWGPRVARTIPTSTLPRLLAFLFSSGSAGGTLWAMLFLTATAAAYDIAAAAIPPRWSDATHAFYPIWLQQGLLAIFAYAMTALLLRRTWLRRVPPRATWGIALGLFLTGVLVPPLLLYLGYHGTAVFKQNFGIVTMLNPFPRTDAPPEALRSYVLGGWALLAFAANTRWFAAQWRAFRPPPAPLLFDVREPGTSPLAMQENPRP